MKSIYIIGGGISSFVCAITLARRNYKVTILERNDTVLKKLLLTGNGKCNYWNMDQNSSHYHTSSGDSDKYINEERKNKVLPFYESIGIMPNIKNGYYYPYSNQAVSVKQAFLNEVKTLPISIICNSLVKNITKEGDIFTIYTDDATYTGDAVVLACGGMSYPTTGSDGMGYQLAKALGHKIVTPLPSLVQLVGNENYKEWNGIRVNARLSLKSKEKIIEEGELMLTDYGISGICTFNISGYVSLSLEEEQNVLITINFLPFLHNVEELKKWIETRNQALSNRSISALFDGVINYKLIYYLLKRCKISPNLTWCEIQEEKQREFLMSLIAYEFRAVDTKGFSSAQVTKGGVSLETINDHFESKLVKNLYFIGEILDIDGDCGGYNIGISTVSGIVVGESLC